MLFNKYTISLLLILPVFIHGADQPLKTSGQQGAPATVKTNKDFVMTYVGNLWSNKNIKRIKVPVNNKDTVTARDIKEWLQQHNSRWIVEELRVVGGGNVLLEENATKSLLNFFHVDFNTNDCELFAKITTQQPKQ